jgi:hypothetical protein
MSATLTAERLGRPAKLHDALNPLDLVELTPVMKLTNAGAEIVIGLIDGPVLTEHPDLVSEKIRTLPGKAEGRCTRADSVACEHGTFVAGILCAKRESRAPAICPGCTLLTRCKLDAECKSQLPALLGLEQRRERFQRINERVELRIVVRNPSLIMLRAEM